MRQSLAPLLLGLVWMLMLSAVTEPRPVPDFRAPVRGTVQLSGTFGELRGNHFHGGVDIRGPQGTPVYAPADGYVARIRVEGGGYGQALFLNHEHGYTTLYGHLDRFAPAIAEYVRRQQYDQESFAVELELGPELFPVRQGDLIGFIGNRGYSFGPHLHYEVRETATQTPLNPMHFGISVPDTRPPLLRLMRVYEMDSRGTVYAARNLNVAARGGAFQPTEDTIFVSQAYTGLALKTYDQQNAVNNLNGIYALSLKQDDSLRYAFRFDAIPYEETRYLNAHLDYSEQRQRNSWFHRCFRLPGNHLGIYDRGAGDGFIYLLPGQSSRVSASITDLAGNKTNFNCVIKRRWNSESLLAQRYNYLLPYHDQSIIDNGSLFVHFPEGCFYTDVHLNYNMLQDASQGFYSPVHRLHESSTPVHSYFRIGIRPNAIAPELRPKAIVAHCENGSAASSLGGAWGEDGRLYTEARTFGDFCIMVDSVAPSITPIRFSDDMRRYSQFSFRIRDNFSTSGPARGLRYRATVDGHWILMEYDAKSSTLYHTFDGTVDRGPHELILTVTDDRENTRVFQRKFVR